MKAFLWNSLFCKLGCYGFSHISKRRPNIPAVYETGEIAINFWYFQMWVKAINYWTQKQHQLRVTSWNVAAPKIPNTTNTAAPAIKSSELKKAPLRSSRIAKTPKVHPMHFRAWLMGCKPAGKARKVDKEIITAGR
jgi:hypothetical protein